MDTGQIEWRDIQIKGGRGGQLEWVLMGSIQKLIPHHAGISAVNDDIKIQRMSIELIGHV